MEQCSKIIEAEHNGCQFNKKADTENGSKAQVRHYLKRKPLFRPEVKSEVKPVI